ncbi:MAG: hypothetical protein V7K35_01210 [Nostoc sp.]|uniref:hypothetical protein n=1 Tax=Nostoc sp. TaxID=1180 RepID=UPI002FF861C5
MISLSERFKTFASSKSCFRFSSSLTRAIAPPFFLEDDERSHHTPDLLVVSKSADIPRQ